MILLNKDNIYTLPLLSTTKSSYRNITNFIVKILYRYAIKDLCAINFVTYWKNREKL